MEAFVPYGYRPFWPSGLQLLEAITDKISPNLHNRFMVTNSFFGEPCAVRTDVTLGVVDYCASHFEPHERPSDSVTRNGYTGGPNLPRKTSRGCRWVPSS